MMMNTQRETWAKMKRHGWIGPRPDVIRLWIYWNGSPVRLTLYPGTEVQIGSHQPTEEGFERVEHSYENVGGAVVRTVCRFSRDCGGRYDQLREDEARIDHTVGITDDNGVSWLEWRNRRERVRDHEAERAGY